MKHYLYFAGGVVLVMAVVKIIQNAGITGVSTLAQNYL